MRSDGKEFHTTGCERSAARATRGTCVSFRRKRAIPGSPLPAPFRADARRAAETAAAPHSSLGISIDPSRRPAST